MNNGHFKTQHNRKILGYKHTENLPEGNIVAWHDSQIFSSEKKETFCVSKDLNNFNFATLKRDECTHHQPGLLSFVSGASSGAERGSRPPGSSYILPSEES